MEMHMVWETAAGEIAVVAAFVDLDNGAEAATTTAAPAAGNLRRGHHPHSPRRAPEPGPAADGAFGGISGFLTTPMLRPAAGVSSTLLETVFSQVEEIATPGSVVKTEPLVMSELVDTLVAGSFQRCAANHNPSSRPFRTSLASHPLRIKSR